MRRPEDGSSVSVRRCRKNYWVARGRKHSLTSRRGRYIARRKEIYKLHSRSYGELLARAGDPSWRKFARRRNFHGRTVKLRRGMETPDCEEETETAFRHGIFSAWDPFARKREARNSARANNGLMNFKRETFWAFFTRSLESRVFSKFYPTHARSRA